ncbi:MAG: PPOX class F420-dependent oxidoreductase [Mycobacteriaceae bacterium]
MAPELDTLAAAEYVALTTFRKNGTAVPTPVWIARRDAELVVWTERDAGKVKRVRRDPRVQVAVCDLRGRVKGESASGTARVLDAEATEQARTAIARAYGIKGRLVMAGSKLRRGRDGTVGIAIALD